MTRRAGPGAVDPARHAGPGAVTRRVVLGARAARPGGRVRRVTTRDELDALSSRELHDLAVRRALHHADVEFLWELLRSLPVAEAVEGHPEHAGIDIAHASALIGDAIDSGQGDLAEGLRPLYLDYLVKHGTAT